MLPHIIMIRSIHNLRKDMRAHDHTLTFVITRKCKEKKVKARTVSTKFSSRFTVLLKLYAKGKKEYLMEKNIDLQKYQLERVALFPVCSWCIFQLPPSDVDSMFTISERLNSELTKIQREYFQLIIGPRNSSISKYTAYSLLKKSRSRVPLLY